MRVGLGLRAALAGVLLVAAIGAVATPAEGTVPGAAAKVRAAIVQERRALQDLSPAGSGRGSYARPLAHANAAVADLLAVQAAFATAARETGLFPHIATMQRLLDSAVAGGSGAAQGLSHALWLIDHGAPAGSTAVSQARSDLRQALAASTALAKLLR